MKVGDKVRVVAIPPGLKEGKLKTRTVFQKCLGHIFPIVGFQYDLIELEVGEIFSMPAPYHSIWLEPGFVELAMRGKTRSKNSKGIPATKPKSVPAAKRRNVKARHGSAGSGRNNDRGPKGRHV